MSRNSIRFLHRSGQQKQRVWSHFVAFVIFALITTIPHFQLVAKVKAGSLVRYYDDGRTKVISPHMDVTSLVREGAVQISLNGSSDIITSASSDVNTFSSTMEDVRREVGGGLLFNLDRGTFGLNYINSIENDYASHLFALSTSRDFFEKNTTLGISMVYGNDNIWGSLFTGGKRGQFKPMVDVPEGANHMINETYTLSLTQVLSKLDIVQFLVDFRIESGILNSPYRESRFFEGDPRNNLHYSKPENLPRTRNRQAYTLKWNHYLMNLDLASANSARFYFDSWGVRSLTGETRFTKTIGPLEIALSGRVSQQKAAKFYKDAYLEENPPFHTGNKTLGEYTSIHLGLRPTLHLSDTWSIFLKGEAYIQDFAAHTDIGKKERADDNKPLSILAWVAGFGIEGEVF